MGYYVSHMIGIRTGGVFSGDTNVDDMKTRISKIIQELRNTDYNPNIPDDPSDVMSKELRARKGSYVVIAGVFNYWTFEAASMFSNALSKEFCVEVMHMCWDEQKNEVQCQIYLDGRPLLDVVENPLGRIIRRVS